MKIRKTLCAIIIAFLIIWLIPAALFSAESYEQKAVDVLYKALNKFISKLSAVFDETSNTSFGEEFPCHKYEVSQYAIDLSSYGPPIALSTSVIFSKPEENFSGIYITIFVLNSSAKTNDFLKTMSDEWVLNSSFNGLPALEIKSSEEITNFFFTCGRYIIREEAFSAKSLRDDLYKAAMETGLCKDTQTALSPVQASALPQQQPPAGQTESSDDVIADVAPDEVRPETAEAAGETSEPETSATTESSTETTTAETEETTQQAAPEVTEQTQPPVQQTQTTGQQPPSAQEQSRLRTQEQAVIAPSAPTPYEPWMNHWQIVATYGKSKYVFDSADSLSLPPGGGYKMIALKPKGEKNPAMLEGRFKPKDYRSVLYMRVAGVNQLDASAVVTVEVNGYPVLKGKVISGSDGWQDININIGSLNPTFAAIIIKVYPNPGGKGGPDVIYIDDIAVDGAPMISKGLKITKEETAEAGSEAPALTLNGLWTDLRNMNYVVRQKGNKFTFSCSDKMDNYLWEVQGEGTIVSETKVTITFTEKWPPLQKVVRSSATGFYDSTKRMITWTTDNKRFPGEWLFIK